MGLESRKLGDNGLQCSKLIEELSVKYAHSCQNSQILTRFCMINGVLGSFQAEKWQDKIPEAKGFLRDVYKWSASLRLGARYLYFRLRVITGTWRKKRVSFCCLLLCWWVGFLRLSGWTDWEPSGITHFAGLDEAQSSKPVVCIEHSGHFS